VLNIKYEIEENMCIMFHLSSMTILLVDWRQKQNVEQRVPKLMNIISFEQHLHCNENGTLVELNGIIKNNELRVEIKSNYVLQKHQAF